MEKTQTIPWDPAEHLETGEDMAAYLNVALEEGDLSLIMATLGDIARARRMALVAQETGLGRESLYKSLAADGNPEFATVLKVVRRPGTPASRDRSARSNRRTGYPVFGSAPGVVADLNRDSPDQTNFPGNSSFWDAVKYNPAFQGRQMRPDSLKFPVFHIATTVLPSLKSPNRWSTPKSPPWEPLLRPRNRNQSRCS